MSPRGCDFESSLGVLLAAHVGPERAQGPPDQQPGDVPGPGVVELSKINDIAAHVRQ